MTKRPKVLVVDDSDFQADMLESTLHDIGIEDITKTVDGMHALQHFSDALGTAEPYSLVFLDIMMPEMDGQEVLKRIRDFERDAGISGDARATVIMTTSLDSPQDMLDAIGGDCDDYIVKPVLAVLLKRVLAKFGFF